MHKEHGARNPWDEVARTYDEARPSYPDQLIEDIIEKARLSPYDRLLEIGAGTGKATVMFAEKGYRIHCIEPGPNLADILIEKCARFGNVSVDIASFEEWTPADDGKFDLILCAQAFNWLDPRIRYRKCHELLKDGGHLALFWYGDCARMDWESGITSSGYFKDPQSFCYQLESRADADSWIKIIESQSSFTLLDDDEKSRIRDEARRDAERQGGFVTTTLDYKLFLAKGI